MRARTLLVPNTASGSVEHFYHFFLGYLCPAVLWIDRTGAREVTVRECGPLTSWFDLLSPWADLEVIAPEALRARVGQRAQPRAILPPLDNPMLFDGRAMARFAGLLRELADVLPPTGPGGVIVSDRGPSDPFYSTARSQVRTAGSDRRSVPNMPEVAAALAAVGPVRCVDAATLHPREQIALLAGSGLLVGQHGAGLAGMVLMPPGSRVIEVLPPVGEGVVELFGDLAAALGLSYDRVPQAGMHSDVDVAAVLAAARRPTPPVHVGAAARARRGLLRVGKRAEVRLLRSRSLGGLVRLVRRR